MGNQYMSPLEDMLWELISAWNRWGSFEHRPEATRESFLLMWQLGKKGVKEEVVRIVYNGDEGDEEWREVV